MEMFAPNGWKMQYRHNMIDYDRINTDTGS